jgi:hypothetical protein
VRLKKIHAAVTVIATGAVPVALGMIFPLIDRRGYELADWVLWTGAAMGIVMLVICLATAERLGVTWRKERREPPAESLMAPQAAPEIPQPRVFLYLFPFDYREGAHISGINWEQGYSHIEIVVRNESDVTYENLSIIFQIDRLIRAVTVVSPLNVCRIAPLGDSGATFAVASGQVMPAEGEIELYSDASRLVCDKFVARSDIKLVMATIEGDILAPRSHTSVRNDPTGAMLDLSYVALGTQEYVHVEGPFYRMDIGPLDD